MKKHLQRLAMLLLLLACFPLAQTTVFAQVQLLPLYQYGRTTAAYNEISGGYLLGTATTDDEVFVDPAGLAGVSSGATGVGLPIGFDFTYNGVVYDRLAVNANGWICLGSSTLTPSVNTGGSSYTPLSSTTAITPAALAAKIAGFARDLQGQTNSSIRIETIGTAPNRVCVVQWKGYRAYNATGNNYNFQIRLLETTNTVEVAFGVMGAGTGSYTGMLGLRAEPAATATNFLSLSSTTS
ncbi:MAG: hypothetical protein ACKOBI_05890, partial [Bacteroidota bacterium]